MDTMVGGFGQGPRASDPGKLEPPKLPGAVGSGQVFSTFGGFLCTATPTFYQQVPVVAGSFSFDTEVDYNVGCKLVPLPEDPIDSRVEVTGKFFVADACPHPVSRLLPKVHPTEAEIST